jgi:hypothetical protein
VFRNEPLGGATVEGKAVVPTDVPARSSGPAQRSPVDVVPPPPPEVWMPAPPRRDPDHDTGLVFSNGPLRVTDQDGNKH